MKRDIDLARQLLLDVENRGPDCAVSVLRTAANHEVEERIRYHLRLLIDAGLLKEVDRAANGAPCVRLTHDGHELIELIRSEGRWREAKWACQERIGGLSLTVIRGILVRWAVGGVRQQASAGHFYGRRRRAYVPVAPLDGEPLRPRYIPRPEAYRYETGVLGETPRYEPTPLEDRSPWSGRDWWGGEEVRYVRVRPEARDRWHRNGVGVDLDGDGMADVELDAVLPDYLI